jgi:ABC-type multidrug transport system, ATPase component
MPSPLWRLLQVAQRLQTRLAANLKNPAQCAMATVLSIQQLTKTYASGVQALHPIDLDIEAGEIFALLGPNGAGKTTLIGIVCGIVTASSGSVRAAGFDIAADYREARSRIGLVPQELATDMWEKVWDTVRFSRGLFGLPARSGVYRNRAAPAQPVGQTHAHDHEPVGRHEAALMIARRSRTSPKFCFWTSRPPASTSNCGAICGNSSASYASRARRSS